ncbi:MAG: AMP-binding protein [Chloroflexi bacterium]|nr:AMP-binding protein [Chloroflexota bacterium]
MAEIRQYHQRLSQQMHHSEMIIDWKTSTLVDILRMRAHHQPNETAYIFLRNGETEEVITYGELDRQARTIGAQLQSLAEKETHALLLYPPGLEGIAAFLGCLYAGVVAIFAPVPSSSRSTSRVHSMMLDAQVTAVLGTTTALNMLETRMVKNPSWGTCHFVNTNTLDSALAESWQKPELTGNTVAYLQYTSGSTGTPKGVMISHGNLLYNSAIMDNLLQLTADTIHVMWMPIFHDAGLVGGVIHPLYSGCSAILMPPVSVLLHPIRWLRAITRYKATLSAAPNFAYELCVRNTTPEERESLDLRTWERPVCGAEPIRLGTLDRFAQTFEPYGFRRSAFYPSYGLAEATLMVTGGSKTKSFIVKWVNKKGLEKNFVEEVQPDSIEAYPLFGCGSVGLDDKLIIVQPETLTPQPPGQVGEIWLSSPSVAQGYWNRPEETEQAFCAYLADGTGPFLRTGDLGFLDGTELFVTGRLKELIIIRGRNHYPQDIELTVTNSHLALQSDSGAVFSIEVADEERLVIVQEVNRHCRNLEEIIAAIQQTVAEEHGLKIYAIALIQQGKIPKTPSGKIARRPCREQFLAKELPILHLWQERVSLTGEAKRMATHIPVQPTEPLPKRKTVVEIETWLLAGLSQRLKVPIAELDPQEPFTRYGLDSAESVSVIGELETWLGLSLPPTLAWDYPNPRVLARYLAGESPTIDTTAQISPQLPPYRPFTGEPIAIIGLYCRFPGAENPAAFWRLLRNGVDAIAEIPADRWDVDAFYDPNPGTPGKMYTRWGGFLSQVDQFDPHFFQISPREAMSMDPQQRLLLEVVWEALEDAGQAPEKLAGSQTGVFIGIASSDYFQLQRQDGGIAQLDLYAGIGSALTIAANRISYLLDLRGPSVAMDTACSSSLVAVHFACEGLRSGATDMGIAGGVSLILSPDANVIFCQAQMLSASGHCRAFDASADSYVRGEGAGVVILKRLSDAVANGDRILAIIRGSAINQDGRSNGLVAPNGLSQQAVIRRALENAGITADQISYVETHGTGTPLGDPIEVNSLKAVLMQRRSPDQPCAIGSVKTNIGHLDAAAGIAGLIKTVLAFQHEQIPPHLHFKTLNPHISLAGTPIYIPTRLQPWNTGAEKRCAGVSSFGIGGTNAHVILEEAPPPGSSDQLSITSSQLSEQTRSWQLLTLSAKTSSALETMTANLASYLKAHPDQNLADVAYTLHVGRNAFKHCRMLVCRDLADAVTTLEAGDSSRGLTGTQALREPPVAFMFPGLGDHYVNMAIGLYQTESTFREQVDHCSEILQPLLGLDLRDVLYPDKELADGAAQKLDPDLPPQNQDLDLRKMLGRDRKQEKEATHLNQTALVHPAVFVIEYALAQLWMEWGIRPSAMLGYSVGEYVAACLSGVFSLEDALTLVSKRAQMIQELPGGAMLAVPLSEKEVQPLLNQYLFLSAINGTSRCVVSGSLEAIAGLENQLTEKGLACRRLQASHAFHSKMMEPLLASFTELVKTVNLAPPKIPYLSNVTGTWITAEEATDPGYWARHMCLAVRFADGLLELSKESEQILLEVGPGQTLSSLAWQRQETERDTKWVILPSLPHSYDRQPEVPFLLGTLGKLWLAGIPVNWDGFHSHEKRRRLALPTYPFERKRYWSEFAKIKRQVANSFGQPRGEAFMFEPTIAAAPTNTRLPTILAKLQDILGRRLAMEPAEVDAHIPFFETGADSLVLVETARAIQYTFGITLSIRQMIEEVQTLANLANYIDQVLPPDFKLVDLSQQIVEARPSSSLPVNWQSNLPLPGVLNGAEAPLHITALNGVITQQLQIMSQQLDVLRTAYLSVAHDVARQAKQAAPEVDGQVVAEESEREEIVI